MIMATLVTWRVSRLLVHEDGPGRVVARLRDQVDRTPLVGLLDCFGCTSIWVGAVVALLGQRRDRRPTELIMTALALSGAAFVVQQLLEAAAPDYVAEPLVESDLVTVDD